MSNCTLEIGLGLLIRKCDFNGDAGHCRRYKAVFENTYFTFFFRFQKNMTLRSFLNDVSKSRKKSLAKV